MSADAARERLARALSQERAAADALRQAKAETAAARAALAEVERPPRARAALFSRLHNWSARRS